MFLSMKKKIVKNQQELVIFRSSNFIKHKSNSDRKKALSVKVYLIKIR